ncbi:hypothetical protein Tco_0883489 [Tanacetum coccineum]
MAASLPIYGALVIIMSNRSKRASRLEHMTALDTADAVLSPSSSKDDDDPVAKPILKSLLNGVSLPVPTVTSSGSGLAGTRGSIGATSASASASALALASSNSISDSESDAGGGG